MIRQMMAAEASNIAKLHISAFKLSPGILPALTKIYGFIQSSPLAQIFLSIEDNQLKGFIIATTDRQRLVSDIFSRHPQQVISLLLKDRDNFLKACKLFKSAIARKGATAEILLIVSNNAEKESLIELARTTLNEMAKKGASEVWAAIKANDPLKSVLEACDFTAPQQDIGTCVMSRKLIPDPNYMPGPFSFKDRLRCALRRMALMSLFALLTGAQLAWGQAVIMNGNYFLTHNEEGTAVNAAATTTFNPNTCLWYVNNRYIQTANSNGDYFDGSQYYARYNNSKYIENYALANNITYLNYFDKMHELNLNDYDHLDEAHLSYTGTVKFTNIIGKYLKDNYVIEDKRLDSKYDYVNEDYEYYEHFLNGHLFFEANDINTYLQLLDRAMEERNLMVIFCIKDIIGEFANEEINKNIHNLGLTIDLVENYGWKGYAAIIDNNEVIYEKIADKIGGNVYYKNTVNNLDIVISSKPFNDGNIGDIIIGGTNYSTDGRGLNIVVFDKDKHKVIDSVCFDLHAYSVPFTRKEEFCR